MYISIKNRLILFLILFTLLPFVLLRIIAYPRIQSDVQEVLIRNLDGIGHKQAQLVTNWINERMKNARIIANNPLMIRCVKITKEDKEYPDIVQYIETVRNECGYKGVYISNDKGSVTVSTRAEEIGNDISKTDYFREGIQGNTFVSGIMPSEIPLTNEFGQKELGMPTMFVSTPLKDTDGGIIGVVSVRVDVNNLNELMLSLNLGKTGETYLVNKDGYMVTESRFAAHLKEMGLVKKRCALELKLIDRETGELTKGVQICVSGINGFDAKGYKDYSGVTVLGAWRWLPEYNLGVLSEIDRDEGYGAAYNLNSIVSFVLLILAFPFALAAYFIGRKTSIPIIRLTEATEKMASGDLTQRVDIRREDEIGMLANSFNAMAKSLDEKTKEIAASEKRYRELFNSLKEGVYQSEPGVEGVFTFINNAGAEILGYSSPEEIIGTRVKNIYGDPEDRRRLCEKLEKDGIWREFVSLCKRKNGESFYAERTSNLLRDERGNPIAIHGVFRDISVRKKAEMEVVESEKRYRVLFDSLKEGVYQSEPTEDGVFTWINQAGVEILGYKSPKEVIGTKVKDMYVNPDDRRKIVEKLTLEGVWRNFTTLCKRKNGERFYMERTSNLVSDDKGKPARIDGIFRDITERKRLEAELQESERHYRELLNSLREGIYQCEPTEDGVFTWINQAGAEILGYNSPEEVIGTRVKDVYVNPNDRKELIVKLEKEGVWREFTSYCKRKNGERFISERTSTFEWDESGNPIRITGVFRDITER
ncbi:MAG: PAS domain S-box protein [Candidatus Brocadia sp. AMX2]|uniref:PAS domain S-box protein n=1 Tax=Candidatus Brocadia sinica JPN1 TaxID=1197129 RepID=A0ABQ0K3L6_9BACT|nr:MULTISPECIES: PAS domain S-box protein [Brocadia]MBC6932645.1 PAS domain S-box protein [Candidatus Brocadia sp.]MBL1169538.1 PAS domain S-box protein [Candidatus Brocadia sp. AMX1]MCK6467186.1 PAS domain S-box protein [Candidatus Brocadia sinica]NOG43029.1 PAS domain S-box protein [Planctomycetota bacterium]KAA0243921.1 MAG: PAS domain S-box protein [Candidatus Brocadia sp. AMX2]